MSSNDYNKNIKYLGIVTNFKVINDMPGADLPRQDIDFTASVVVFTSMTQEIAVPTDNIMVPPAPPSISYDVLCQRYKTIKNQHGQAEAQKLMNSTGKSGY
ncbi:hypothetical protein EC968_007925 [Mortierella alpina]|nr:hypothetical protein EC968_007925 [Mortierella alpina]